MTVAADQATALALACHTGDRTDAEHKALLRVADRLDRQRNRCTYSNRRFDHDAHRVPCTAPLHGAKCPTCLVHLRPGVELLVPPFTDAAKAEALVDEHGWSIAAAIVDQTREAAA